MNLLLVTLTAFGASASEADVDALVAAALDANPRVAAAEQRVAALRASARVAGSWSDPVLAVEYSNAPVDSFDISAHPMGGVQFKLQQRFPTSGAPVAAGEAARLAADEADAGLAEVQVMLEAAVRRAWWRLAEVRLLRGVTERHRDAASALLDAVRARYEVGKASQADLLRLGVLEQRLDDSLGDHDSADRGLVAELRRTTGHDGTFDTPEGVVAIEPDALVSEWLAEAGARPAVRALAVRIARQEASADLARARHLPDLSVWLGYRLRLVSTQTDPGTDFLTLGVSAPLPVAGVRKGAGDAAAARSQARATEAERLALLDDIAAELEAEAAGWRRSHDKAARYEDDLLPAARRAWETTLSDYRVGKADVPSLFQAEVQLFDLERAVLRAAIDTHVHQATVGGLLGRSLVTAGGEP